MSAIGVGDWVECVDATDCQNLAVGVRYQVERIFTARLSWYGDHRLRDGIDLVGVPRDEPDCCYDLVRFRPISAPKSELLQSLLRKAKEPIKEDV